MPLCFVYFLTGISFHFLARRYDLGAGSEEEQEVGEGDEGVFIGTDICLRLAYVMYELACTYKEHGDRGVSRSTTATTTQATEPRNHRPQTARDSHRQHDLIT